MVLPHNSTGYVEGDGPQGYATVMLLVFCILMLILAFLGFWLEKNKVRFIRRVFLQII